MGKRRRNKALVFGGVIVVGGTTWLTGTAGADGPPPPPSVAPQSLMVPAPASTALDEGGRTLVVALTGVTPSATTTPAGVAPAAVPTTTTTTAAPSTTTTTTTAPTTTAPNGGLTDRTGVTVPVPVPAAVPLAAPLHLAQPVAILGVVAENLAIGRTAAIEVVLTARPDGASVIAGSTPHYAPEPPATTVPAPVGPADPSDAALAALRDCEAGGDYGAVSWGGLYRGAYQFDQSTWDSVTSRWYPHLVGADPATVSPAEQDAVARALYAERGWQPWPVCGRSL